jgi:DNA polymerase V
VTDQLVLTVGYDVENLKSERGRQRYRGEIKTDRYGREIPKHAHGTENLKGYTASMEELMAACMRLYDRIVDQDLLIRRLTLSACRVLKESGVEKNRPCEQLDIFSVMASEDEKESAASEEKEKRIRSAMLDIRRKYGKNAILKGTSLEDGATAKERNSQIGGHKA